MGWKIWADQFGASDFSGSPVKWQAFTPSQDVALKAIRSYFVFYNADFSGISFRLYSYKNSRPYTLLYTSDDNIAKADLISATYGVQEGYWAFTNPPFLKGGDTYALVPWVSDYAFAASRFISWRKCWPTLRFAHNSQFVTAVNNSLAPYDFTLITGELL